MGVKELQRWMDSIGMAPAPWACDSADWATGLNVLARLLHSALAQRVEEQTRLEAKAQQVKDEEEGKEEERSIGSSVGPKRAENDVIGKGEENAGVEEAQKKQEEEGEADIGDNNSDNGSRRPSQTHPSTQLTFQEAMEMAEHVLGVPQLVLVADIKRAGPDIQLALFVLLCALQFAMGSTETKSYRDLQFAFRIYFDMDEDGSSRQCTACGQLVHLIERLVLNGQCWHRACLKCALCGRQLYRGTFHFVTTTVAAPFPDDTSTTTTTTIRPECVEHFANSVLFGDPKHRFALQPTSLFGGGGTNASEKRASLAAMSISSYSSQSQQQQCSPPPRPPPPKVVSTGTAASSAATGTPKMPKSNDGLMVKRREQQKQQEENAANGDEGGEESIEKKIASAAAARHDVPVPKPRQSLLLHQQQLLDSSSSKQSRAKGGAGAKANAWEVLEYPEELNPFGCSDEEAEEEEGADAGEQKQQQKKMPTTTGTMQKQRQLANVVGNNPFDSEEEDDDSQSSTSDEEEDEEEEGGIVQLDNPLDRVLVATSPRPHASRGNEAGGEDEEDNSRGDSTTPECSTCSSPAHAHYPDQQRPVMVQLVKPPAKTTAAAMVQQEKGTPNSQQQYVPPLGPMPFRVVVVGRDERGGGISGPDQQQQQQVALHELDTKLRRLHSQLDQWEITGARLEVQMLRALGQSPQQQQQIWRKSNKLTNDYVQLMVERLTALAKEAVLVRRYMDIFLGLAHAELDRQMKATEQQRHRIDAKSSRQQFNDLLAQLLHIKNELMELEQREREARVTAAATATAGTTTSAGGKSSVEKGMKKEEIKKEQKRLKKMKKLEEKEKTKQLEQQRKEEQQSVDGEEGKKQDQEVQRKEKQTEQQNGGSSSSGKSASGSGTKLLKNTLRNLKKKL